MQYLINADDFGRTPSKTAAIDWGIRQGIIHRTSLMMNMESTEMAIELAKAGQYMDRICFHLNLTDGTPLTERIKKTDVCNEKGDFCRCSNRRFQRKCFHVRVISAIRQECEAQMRLFREKGFRSDHVDSHLWCLCNFPVWFAIRPLLRKYGFRTIRSMNGHLITYEAGKLHRYYSMLQKAIGCSTISWSEDWAGCADEFQKQVLPTLDRCYSTVELYVHPDFIDDTAMDTVFNYKGEKRPLTDIAALLTSFQSMEANP